MTTPVDAASSVLIRDREDDDRQLAERASSADADAFGELYRRYVARIHAFAWYRTHDREAAEEITSAAFERAWRAMPDFVWRGGGFQPWLFRIAATEAAGWHRRRGRAGQALQRLAAEPVAGDDPEPVADHRHAQLLAALHGLRPRYQEVITLRYLSGLSPEEAAEVMGCSKATLTVILHRAMNALRQSVGGAESSRQHDELRDRLGRVAAPTPRAEFVDRLANRLQWIDPVETAEPVALPVRRALPGFLALGALAVLAALLVALLPGATQGRDLGVTGEPPAAEPDVGTAVAPPPATTTTSAAAPPASIPGPTTTVAAAAPKQDGRPAVEAPAPPVRPVPTTTPVKTAAEPMRLACAAQDARPAVRCEWSQSTDAAFAGYRLWRATGTGPKQVVFTTADRAVTSYLDRPEPGRQQYMVEALDGQGRVVGRSKIVEAFCC